MDRTAFWIRMALFNLLLVALLGMMMRYKILFELPALNQKYLQTSHSNFAFVGWVGQALMVLLYETVRGPSVTAGYGRVFWLYAFFSYAMLFSFAFSGYSALSVAASIGTMLAMVFFARFLWRDLNRSQSLAGPWFKTALVFYFIGALGGIGLPLLQTVPGFSHHWYLSVIYFQLHFTYNGWFWFAIGGLFFNRYPQFDARRRKRIFWLFASSCIPAYLLSVLWLDMGGVLYVATALSAVAQVAAWVIFIAEVRRFRGDRLKRLLQLVLLCASVKLLLQLGSVVPEISKLAFGFRPIVIAYLHLVLLAIISLYILIEFYLRRHVAQKYEPALYGFAIFILLNELILGVQGVASFWYIPVVKANEMLLAASIGLSAFALYMFVGATRVTTRIKLSAKKP